MRAAVRRTLAAVLVACLAAGRAHADDVEPGRISGVVRQERLAGNPFGLRSRLMDRGVDIVLVYTGEVWGTVHGGVRRHARYLDNSDLILDADLERLVGWKGASAVLYGLGNEGGSPTEDVGDAMRVSNIDAPDTWKLYEAWVDQSLWSGRFSIRAGLQNLNGEFYVNDVSAMFINSSFGMGQDFAQSGKNGPSIFPVTSAALRLRARTTLASYAQFAVLDGVPGDPRHPDGTQIAWRASDGLLLVGEVGWAWDAGLAAATKVAAGAWGYTTRLDTVESAAAGRGTEERGSHGAYAVAERTFFAERVDLTQGLAAFVRGGWADPAFNPYGGFAGAGAVYTDLVPTRDVDRLGLAVASAIGGSDFRDGARRAGTPLARAETAIELTYRLELTPWLALQPDVQYVIDPSLSRSIPDALAVALRFRVLL
jgi:porin